MGGASSRRWCRSSSSGARDSRRRAGSSCRRGRRRIDQPRPAADVVVLAVRDEAITEVAARIMASVSAEDVPPILLHCAGALPAEEAFAPLTRRPLGVGVVHPLRALAGGVGDE